MQPNRIARYLDRQSRRNPERAAFAEGGLARERGDGLARLILLGWQRWPGTDEQKAHLVAISVCGFLRAGRQTGD
jgi:hypothetical protein